MPKQICEAKNGIMQLFQVRLFASIISFKKMSGWRQRLLLFSFTGSLLFLFPLESVAWPLPGDDLSHLGLHH